MPARLRAARLIDRTELFDAYAAEDAQLDGARRYVRVLRLGRAPPNAVAMLRGAWTTRIEGALRRLAGIDGLLAPLPPDAARATG